MGVSESLTSLHVQLSLWMPRHTIASWFQQPDLPSILLALGEHPKQNCKEFSWLGCFLACSSGKLVLTPSHHSFLLLVLIMYNPFLQQLQQEKQHAMSPNGVFSK